jgi:hypothetical protein
LKETVGGTSNRRNDNAGGKNNTKTFYAWSDKDVTAGEAIARVLTGMWNSQKNPGKIYICSYRVHHGAIGFVGAVACAYFNRPMAFGFFKHLMDDDRDDWHEWFSGERLSKSKGNRT